MLTPEQIEEMDKVTGWGNIPTQPVMDIPFTSEQTTPTISRADEVRQKIAESRKVTDSSYKPDMSNLEAAQTIPDAFKGFFKDVAFNTTKMNRARGDMGSTIDNSADLVNKGEQTVPEAVVQTIASSAKEAAKNFISPIVVGAKHIAGAVGDIVTAGREAQKRADDQAIAAGTLKPEDALSNKPHFEDQLKTLASQAVDSIIEERNRQKALNPGKKDAIDLYKESSPRTKANIKALTDTTQAAMDFYGGVQGAKTIADLTVAGTSKVGDFVENTKSKIQNKAVDSLETKYQELSGTTKPNIKTLDKNKKIVDLKNAAGTEGKTPERILAENGIVPKAENSKLRTTEQAQEFIKRVEPLQEINNAAIKSMSKKVSSVNLEEQRKAALEIANTTFNKDAGIAKGLAKEINQEYDDLIAEYGDNIPLDKLNDIKIARGKTVFDTTRPQLNSANNAIRKVAQKTVEDVARSNGYTEVAQMNRHIGDMLEAAKFLEGLNGTTISGGRLTRLAAGLIASTAATSIPGKIAAAVGGDYIAKLLIDASVSSPIKRLILRNLEVKDPKSFLIAQKWLADQGVLRDTYLALPAPVRGATTVVDAKLGTVPVAPKGMSADFPNSKNVIKTDLGTAAGNINRSDSISTGSIELDSAKAMEEVRQNLISDIRAQLAAGGTKAQPIAELKTAELTGLVNKFVKDFTPADIKIIQADPSIYDKFTELVKKSYGSSRTVNGHNLLQRIVGQQIKGVKPMTIPEPTYTINKKGMGM